MKRSVVYLKIAVNLLIGIAGILVLCFIVPKVLLFFMPFVIGWIISVIAYPLVRFLEKKVKIVPKLSSVIIIILALALVIGVSYIAIAAIVAEVADFIANIPELYPLVEAEVKEIGESLTGVYNRLPIALQESLDQFGNNLSMYLGDMVGTVGKPTFEAAGRFAMNLPSFLIGLIMTIVSAYFFIADREVIYGFFRKHIPSSVHKNMNFVADKFKQVVGGYIKAQFKIMVVVAVIIFIGLLVLGVDYILLLTLAIAILDFLPIFGSGTVLLPWILYEVLAGDYKMAVGLLVLYAVTQLVRQVIQPKLVGDSIGMNPFLTLIFLFIGFKVKGFLGMIIGIPIGMIIIALYEMGAFDSWIRYIKIIVNDINEFRKIDEE